MSDQVKRPWVPPLRQYLTRSLSPVMVLLASLALFGCSGGSVRLYHPETGATMQCRASGVGLGVNWGESLVDTCKRQFEARGYVEEGALTASQRSKLESRGIIPKD